jgi:NhaA family Na+:H+ antiporter
MNKRLFENQHALEREDLLRYAADLELDMDRFERDLDSNIYAERVQEDFDSGLRSGVIGTPSFFINDVRYDGPWDVESLLEAIEKPLGMRVQLLAQEFMSLAASGGIVLLLGTLIALVWANMAGGEGYLHFWETELGLTIGGFTLSEAFLEWVNDGLMVIFFFVVGLEIKREITSGELANPKRAALPIAAAVGGMLFPAALYALFNIGGSGAPGWGIPMATDIAFTLGILTVLGNRIPLSLKVFFTALAIADDLGAVMVIALFYSEGIAWLSLGIGALFLAALIGLNRARVYSPLPYALLGIGLWLAFLESGVHPTIAGVLLAFTIPTRSPPEIRALLAQTANLLEDFELPPEWRLQADSRRQATVRTLESISERMQSPAQRLEHRLTPWSTYLVLPIFALANAGLSFAGVQLSDLFDPIGLGIMVGLVIGKPVGITLASWLAVRIGLAEKPEGVSWAQLASASCLAGIGFTISLFIAGAAFPDPAQQAAAKLAILVASLLAAIIGWILLRATSARFNTMTRLRPAPSPAR